jgi:endonuclease/exonuclease/phosphatase family metal-dependent hydrolase
MRIATWNLLHAIPILGHEQGATLGEQAKLLNADVIALQEVDRNQERSGNQHQVREVAEALGLDYWYFIPALVGTPGETWVAAHDGQVHSNEHGDEPEGAHYGIGLASRYPLSDIEVLRFPAARLSLPLMVPSPKGPRFLMVEDEPRVALLANILTPDGPIALGTAHLSFVPGVNARQLRKMANALGKRSGRKLLIGDFNLPGGIPRRVTGWHTMAKVATYPTMKPRIQFDHVLGQGWDAQVVNFVKGSAQAFPLGISDHCALVVELP